MSINQPGLAEQATSTRPRLIDQANAARVLGVTPRTVRNLITRGDLTGYRVRGVRAIRVDLNEIRALVERIPVSERSGRQPFGPLAKIVSVGYGSPAETGE